ncbi:MAG: hypothetical protein ACI9SC_003309 [Gammaproteobacteria bacterium]|jgi:hypothetical protein
MKKAIQLLAKLIGIIAGSGTCASWMLAILKPVPAFPLTGIAFVVALLMIIFAILAVIASVHGHGIMLVVLFFCSFLPIGLYLLGDPDWVRVIGFLNFGYLIAGVLIWALAYHAESVESSDV